MSSSTPAQPWFHLSTRARARLLDEHHVDSAPKPLFPAKQEGLKQEGETSASARQHHATIKTSFSRRRAPEVHEEQLHQQLHQHHFPPHRLQQHTTAPGLGETTPVQHHATIKTSFSRRKAPEEHKEQPHQQPRQQHSPPPRLQQHSTAPPLVLDTTDPAAIKDQAQNCQTKFTHDGDRRELQSLIKSQGKVAKTHQDLHSTIKSYRKVADASKYISQRNWHDDSADQVARGLQFDDVLSSPCTPSANPQVSMFVPPPVTSTPVPDTLEGLSDMFAAVSAVAEWRMRQRGKGTAASPHQTFSSVIDSDNAAGTDLSGNMETADILFKELEALKHQLQHAREEMEREVCTNESLNLAGDNEIKTSKFEDRSEVKTPWRKHNNLHHENTSEKFEITLHIVYNSASLTRVTQHQQTGLQTSSKFLKSCQGPVLNCRGSRKRRASNLNELVIHAIRNNASSIFQNLLFSCCKIEFVQLW